jgi:HK97 family phage major capsid protein
MSVRLKELQEQKNALAAEIRRQADKINAEGRDFSAEEQTAWDKVNADYSSIEKRLAVEQKACEVSATLNSPERIPTHINVDTGRMAAGELSEEVRADAIAGFLLRGTPQCTQNRREAMAVCGIDGVQELTLRLGSTSTFEATRESYLSTPAHARRNLSRGPGAASLLTSSTSAAGYLISPGGLYSSLEISRLHYGGVLQVAQVIRTANGEPFNWPTANDTSNTGEQLDEVADIGSSVNPSVGRMTLNAYKYSSKLVRFSYELGEDSSFSLLSVLGEMLGERLGRIGNTRQTVGTGSSQPQGIVTGAGAGVTAASQTAITADELIDLYHSVDIAYRNNPGAGFMAHDTTIKAWRKLKGSDGQYLWQAGGINGSMQDMIRGKPVYTNNDMGTPATGVKTVLFGDLQKFKIREVNEIRIRVLNELFAATDEIGIIAFMRWDSRLLDAGTDPIKYLVQA